VGLVVKGVRLEIKSGDGSTGRQCFQVMDAGWQSSSQAVGNDVWELFLAISIYPKPGFLFDGDDVVVYF
jgi:hypothetical protein